jgi:hypothetical protein
MSGASSLLMSSDFTRAFYIKLGRGGSWESDAVRTGLLHSGWDGQSIADINAREWGKIEDQLRVEHRGKPQVATNDLNRLRDLVESDPADVWVTFHQSKLWWTRVANGPVEQDDLSKFRRTAVPWSDEDAGGHLLVANELPGKLSQLQGFRGTVCRVLYPELLSRVLGGHRSELAEAISSQRAALAERLVSAISELHWKDYETLVDLVFRDSGWVRVSVLGQHAKAYDLELREPITGERYVVQVKSRANLADLERTVSQFSAEDYKRVLFMVHSPTKDLAQASDLPEHVELVPPARLADLAIDAGLVTWLEDKVS